MLSQTRMTEVKSQVSAVMAKMFKAHSNPHMKQDKFLNSNLWSWSFCFSWPPLLSLREFPMAQWVKNRPAKQETSETWVQFLSWEDPLEEGMATHSSSLTWKTPWTEEPGGLQSKGSQGVRHDWATKHTQKGCRPRSPLYSGSLDQFPSLEQELGDLDIDLKGTQGIMIHGLQSQQPRYQDTGMWRYILCQRDTKATKFWFSEA